MGKAPGHDVNDDLKAVETEVDLLRERTQNIVAELERRVHDRVSSAKETVAKVKHAVDLKAQVKEHPRAAGGIGAGALVLIGLGTWWAIARGREERRFVPRMQRKARALGAILRDPERHLQKKEPIGRKILGAVLATAATVIVRALAQRMVQPIVQDRPRLPAPPMLPTIPSA